MNQPWTTNAALRPEALAAYLRESADLSRTESQAECFRTAASFIEHFSSAEIIRWAESLRDFVNDYPEDKPPYDAIASLAEAIVGKAPECEFCGATRDEDDEPIKLTDGRCEDCHENG